MARPILIEGGVPLRGSLRISGSKNSVLPCMAASLLTSETVKLGNVPLIGDMDAMRNILNSLNVKTSFDSKRRVLIISAASPDNQISSDLSGVMRGSIICLGSLLGRTGHVRIDGYGGCQIGSRPIDLHLKAFRLLGASVESNGRLIDLTAQRLRGAKIDFAFPSVGATENALIAACLAEGKTTITNMAIEPEVLDLITLLRSMGASIEGEFRKRVVHIEGCHDLGRAAHKIIPDRIEAGTYAVASAITGGELVLRDVEPLHLSAIRAKLAETGITTSIEGDRHLRVSEPERPLRKVHIETGPYPGFPTDLQAQFTSLATRAIGRSVIVEKLFENRFHHISGLKAMGANITLTGHKVVIDGPTELQGGNVKASDLRGGASLILAALSAEGVTRVEGMNHINRGHERIIQKLRGVGANVELALE